MRFAIALFCLMALVPAYGSVITNSGVLDISPPSSVMPGQLLSNSTMYVFNEQDELTLPDPVSAGITAPGTYICCSGPNTPGTIPAGMIVNSYLLRAAPQTNSPGVGYRDFQGTISFTPGEEVVGIIFGYQNIAATDAMLGASGTAYPPLSFKLGGLENNDEVILEPNDSIYVNFHVNADKQGMDMIRILTASTPEPAEFVLMGSGLAAVALWRRLRSRRG